MEVKSALESAGLSGNEIKVYLALLDIGSALAGEVTKKSGVNRTNVYDALERLTEKGLVSYVIKANRKHFEATGPERIIKYLEEKELEVRGKREMVRSILPELEKRRKLSREAQEATIYSGRKGLKSVAEEVLKTRKEMLAFGAEGQFIKLFTHYAEQWHQRRGKLKIPVKIIYNEKIRKSKSKTDFPLLQMRFNFTIQDTPSTTWIFGDKVAIVVWSDQPIVTLIRSKEVAHSYRQFFEVIWKDSKV
ncbi:MAG TPA: helix-turn-helix domain-containing protein [Candidatus Nanoarchaeia archaeon]|nr:helix-turn-helix domain-containing protein [Candidatus Nanoarchaeia archaeon]